MNVQELVNKVESYFTSLIKRDRVVILYEAGVPICWCTFFIVDSIQEAERMHASKDMWETPKDKLDGEYIYIDKLMCARAWVPSMRREINRLITESYPKLKWSVWFRPSNNNDKIVVREIHREVSNV